MSWPTAKRVFLNGKDNLPRFKRIHCHTANMNQTNKAPLNARNRAVGYKKLFDKIKKMWLWSLFQFT